MRANPLRWLCLAGAIHITLTLAIFLVGHFQLLPSVFDPHGTGLLFALDGLNYREQASQLAGEWQTGGFSAWLHHSAPFHCRLHSILFLTLGRLLGHNIIAVEPLNLLYYLATLSCVYLLGRELFNPRAAVLAATMVAFWPSFLLHSTQFIRDSMAVACLLALLFVLVLLLRRELSWRGLLGVTVAGSALVTLFWVLRGNMWNAVVFAVSLATVLLILRMIVARKFFAANAVGIAALLLIMLMVPSRIASTTTPGTRRPTTALAIPSATQPAPAEGVLAHVLKQLGQRRAGFRLFRAQESNIDAKVQLNSAGDIVRFLPRAAVIGFLAPFPRLWFQRGSFGLPGRLLSGVETLVMYLLYGAVAACLWRQRNRLEVWLLFLAATAGVIGLGLVVINAGALYRLRYAFWIMFIIMAAEAINYLTVLRTTETNSRMSSSVVSNEAINRHSEVSSSQT